MTDKQPLIPGGYYLKARCIQESEIAHAPPHVREIWDWLIKECNHADKKKYGIIIKRGQRLTSYEEIREALHWKIGWRKKMYSKWDCEKAMKVLKKATMIATTKTTRGLLVTVCNYDKYQNPANYESHKGSHTKATRKPQTTDTINKNEKNERTNKDRFDVFWKAYPKKRSKEKAREVWQKLEPDEELLSKMLITIELGKASVDWNKKDLATGKKGQFIPYPASWLNSGGWDDEYTPQNNSLDF